MSKENNILKLVCIILSLFSNVICSEVNEDAPGFYLRSLDKTDFFLSDEIEKETPVLLKILKNKGLDKSVGEYFFKILKDATSLELIINKGVILEGSYIKFLLERLYGYVKK